MLRVLTPGYVRLRRAGAVAEGAIAEFTVWMGPIPIRWRALHRDVDQNGFTDVQDDGPLRSWEHIHRWESIDPATTLIIEHVRYEYVPGWRGWKGRMFFNPVALRAMFVYRAFRTRRTLRG